MEEITFTVWADPESGILIAAWDQPGGGGITTQAESLEALQHEIRDAVLCHFDEGELPERVRIHFNEDPTLSILESA